METEGMSVGAQIMLVLLAAGVVLAAVFILLGFIKMFLYIAKPNEVLILSGRRHKLPDGSMVGYRVEFAGRVFRWPILETIARMDVSLIPVELKVRRAFSKGGIALDIDAIANVKISSDPMVVRNAIERFLGRDRSEIMNVVRENLEGNLRQVVATLTPEEVNQDRLKFAKSLRDEADEDLEKLGIDLDTLKIQNVQDENNYLENLGRQAIAAVLRDSQNAENLNKRDAETRVAEVMSHAQVETTNIEAEISTKKNELRTLKAQLELMAKTSEENAEAAAREAKAIADQEMQSIRAELEQLRLRADVSIPAEAAKVVSELQAKGNAASIAENGKAIAKVMEKLGAVWREAGADAKDIFLIQRLEQILDIVVNSVNTMTIDKVSIVDTGDGTALPAYVASFPATVNAVLVELKRTTGIDIAGVLSGRQQG
jgi:flotillin